MKPKTKLKPYQQPCVKCGSPCVSCLYRSGGIQPPNYGTNQYINIPEICRATLNKTEKEDIFHECNVCHYKWITDCL